MSRVKSAELNSPSLASQFVPERTKKRAGVHVRTVISACAWGYGAALVLLWVLLEVGADRWWPVTILMFAPRWLWGLPLGVLLPVAAAVRPRLLWLLLGLLVLVVGPIMGCCIPWRTFFAGPSSGPTIRVLTCNIHRGQLNGDRLGNLIAETMPDIVALQDWSSRHEQPVFWQRDWHMQRNDDLLLASRFSIRVAKALDTPGDTGRMVRYELETPIGLVHFINVHLASPRNGLEELPQDFWKGAPSLRENIRQRESELAEASGMAGELTGPLIIAGDFNTCTDSVIYGRYWSRFTNAFSSAGWGWGYTHFTRRTGTRIDHILAGSGWRCVRCWVGPEVGSAHRPLLADWEWVHGVHNP